MDTSEQKIDEFLKFMGVELTDWQKKIFIRMVNDPDRKRYYLCFPRGHGYSTATMLARLFNEFYKDVNKAILIGNIQKEMEKENDIY